MGEHKKGKSRRIDRNCVTKEFMYDFFPKQKGKEEF